MHKLTTLISLVVLAACVSAPALPLYDSFSTYGPSGSMLGGSNAPSGESWISYTNVSSPDGTNVYTTNYFVGSSDTPAPNLAAGFPGPLVAGNDTGSNSLWTPGWYGTGAVGGVGACLQFSNPVVAAPANRIYASFFADIPDCSTPYGAGQSLGHAWSSGFLPASELPTAAGANQNVQPAVFEKFNYREASATSWKPGVGDNVATSGTGTISVGSGVAQKTIHFIVIAYDWSTNGLSTNDVERIWLDPAATTFGANTEPSSSAQKFASTSPTALPDASGFFFQSYSATSGSLPNSGVMFNSLRIATNWAYVTGGAQFVSQPGSIVRMAGGSAVLTGSATAGGLSVSYQWQTNGVNVTDGGRFSGSGTASLAISNLQSSDADVSYTVIANTSVSLANGFSVTSSVAHVTVINPPVAPVGGIFQISYTGFSGNPYRLWAAPSVTLTPVTNTWTLLTNDIFSGSLMTYPDTQSSNFPNRYYIITAP